MNDLNELESWSDYFSFAPFKLTLLILIIIAIPFTLITFLQTSLEQGLFAGMVFLVLTGIFYTIGKAVAGILIGLTRG